MKRLPPAKRNQLIGVLVATAILMGAVIMLLIKPQNDKNHDLGRKIKEETERLQQYKDIIKKKDDTAAALADLSQQLDHTEEDVAYGDLYVWSYETLRKFKSNYPKLDIPNPGQPSLGDCDLISGFPYKQIRFHVTGTGFYHDIGKFVADFENRYPHCRVLNLSTEPINNGPTSGERLNFAMDIVAPVKPNN